MKAVAPASTGCLSASVGPVKLRAMSAEMGHRKRVRYCDEPGHRHELTFSCHPRMPLLTNDVWRSSLSVSVGRAVAGHEFRLIAFVYMPEHVHLLVFPERPGSRVSGLLKAVKQPFSKLSSSC
jgi:REP-associated tyrosine transposase